MTRYTVSPHRCARLAPSLAVSLLCAAFAARAQTYPSGIPQTPAAGPWDFFLVETGAPPNDFSRTISLSNLLQSLEVLSNWPAASIANGGLDASQVQSLIQAELGANNNWTASNSFALPPVASGASLTNLPGALNVRDFGAKGDGSTDDTAAFQAAASAGQWVMVPSGTYVLGQVFLTNNTRIFGGKGSIVKQRANGSPVLRVSSAVTNIAIEGLEFDGAQANYADSQQNAGIYLDSGNGSGLDVRDCVFRKFNFGIFGVSNAVNVRIARCTFSQNAGAGLWLGAATKVKVTDCFVDGARAGVGDGATGRVGIWSVPVSGLGGSDWLIGGNTVQNTYNEGIICDAAYSVIANNQVRNCTSGGGTCGIIVEGTPNSFMTNGYGAGYCASVLGNQVSFCDGGIAVRYDPMNIGAPPMFGQVIGNLITDVGASDGIQILGLGPTNSVFGVKVANNKILRCTGTGLYLVDLWDSDICDNHLEGCPIQLTTSTGASNCCFNVSIHNNEVLFPGANPGIYIRPGTGATNAIVNCAVNNNYVAASSTTAQGIQANNGNRGCAYNNNVVIGNGGSIWTALYLQGQAITANGNTGVGTVAGVSYGTYFDLAPVPVAFTSPITLAGNLVVGGTVAGNGSGLTSLNGSNIQAGTINSNALDAATQALLASGGGVGITLAQATNAASGVIAQPNSLNGANLEAGTVNSNALDSATRACLGVGGISPLSLSTLRQAVSIFDDFVEQGMSSTATGPFGFAIAGSGGSQTEITTSQPGNFGVWCLNSGNTAASYEELTTGRAWSFGSSVITNEWLFQVTNLVTAAQGGVLRLGFVSTQSPTLSEPASGLYLRYDTNHATFQYVCRSASAETWADSGLTVAANTWYKVRMVVNNTASATFTINDANAQTIVSNITTAPQYLGAEVLESSGGAVFGVYLDYCYLGWSFANSR